MTEFPDDVGPTLARMGADSSRLGKVQPIQERHGNRLFRVALEGSSCILKVFGDRDANKEVWAYSLLEDLGVPTLRVIARTNDALLLDDLEASKHFRLAEEDDVGRAEVGAALAAWYRALHDSGSNWRAGQTEPLSLPREIDKLTAESILEVASKVRGSDQSRWTVLADNIDRIKNAAVTFEETLTFNDFHWTNLALSRENPVRAVMFDFHLLGVGLRHSDCRNVTGALGQDAADTFRSEYGETDPREKTLDDLLAPLHALVEAFRRPRFPSRAGASLELAETGEIHSRFDRVMEAL